MTLKEIHELTGFLLTKLNPSTIMECRSVAGDRDHTEGFVFSNTTKTIFIEANTSYYEDAEELGYTVVKP